MSELIDELIVSAKEHMNRSVDATVQQFASVRTGRASPAVLDRKRPGAIWLRIGSRFLRNFARKENLNAHI